jgi:hypothetical protein
MLNDSQSRVARRARQESPADVGVSAIIIHGQKIPEASDSFPARVPASNDVLARPRHEAMIVEPIEGRGLACLKSPNRREKGANCAFDS